MSRPTVPSRPSLTAASGRPRFKSSHRRVTLKISHRSPDAPSPTPGRPSGNLRRDEARDRYIAPPKPFRR